MGVLSSVNCVSSLIETGFMTSYREAMFMLNPLFQTEVGEEACHGVCDYLGVNYITRNNINNYSTIRQGSRNNFVFR